MREKQSASTEQWQLEEIQAGIAELDNGEEIPHDEVANWLRSWGTANEEQAPR